MTNERVYLELNEENCKVENGAVTIVVPYEQQSMTGVDFHFNPEFVADKVMKVKSVAISPAPLMCFWNWLMSTYGSPEYEVTSTPIDIAKYQISDIPGTFGFSGYATNESDVTITFTLAGEDSETTAE